MTAGRRNQRIVFQRYTTTTSEMGGEEPTWADYGTPMMARVIHGSGQERREAAQESASVTATFYVLMNPSTAALSPKDRIIWSGSWDIISAVPSLVFNREMEITAVRAAD